MTTIFSEKEQNIRKWWLRIFLFLYAYSLFMFIAIPENHVLAGYLGLFIDLLMKIAVYHFGYQKMGTRWLTTFISFSLTGLAFLFLLALGSTISKQTILYQVASAVWTNTHKIGLVRSIIGYVLGLLFLLANIQLRKINKMRKPPKIKVV
jgi:hypothetical protein